MGHIFALCFSCSNQKGTLGWAKYCTLKIAACCQNNPAQHMQFDLFHIQEDFTANLTALYCGYTPTKAISRVSTRCSGPDLLSRQHLHQWMGYFDIDLTFDRHISLYKDNRKDLSIIIQMIILSYLPSFQHILRVKKMDDATGIVINIPRNSYACTC